MTPAAPPLPPPLPRPPPCWTWLATCLAGAMVLGLLYFFNPAEYRLYPRCLFHVITGWQCPGCGGLRAAHQLLHGNLVAAFRLNPLFFLLLLIGAWFGLRFLVRRLTGYKPPLLLDRPAWLWGLAAVVVLFGILRNLPAPPFSWLQP